MRLTMWRKYGHKLCALTYFQLLIGLRIKQVFFFSVVFPVFIFVLFNFIWNTDGDPQITRFFLSGILMATCVSEGIYALSNTFKKYALSGFILYLQKMFTRSTVVLYFLGLIISRLFVFACISGALITISVLFFNLRDWFFIFRLLAVLPVCIFIFSFLGLALSFTGIKNIEHSLNHVVFYLVVFTSDAYFPASRSPFVGYIGNFFPLNNLLRLVRMGFEFMNTAALLWLLAWLLVPFVTFCYLFFRMKHRKK